MNASKMYCESCQEFIFLVDMDVNDVARCTACRTPIRGMEFELPANTGTVKSVVMHGGVTTQAVATSRPLALVLARIDERIGMHRDNLNLWESGYLSPTEPDLDEQRRIKARLRAAIEEAERIRQIVVDAGV